MVKGRSVNLLASCGHGCLGHSTLVHGLGTCAGGPRAQRRSEGSRPSGSQIPLVGSGARGLHRGSLRRGSRLSRGRLWLLVSLTLDLQSPALHPAAKCSSYHTSSGIQKVSISTVPVQKTAGTGPHLPVKFCRSGKNSHKSGPKRSGQGGRVRRAQG